MNGRNKALILTGALALGLALVAFIVGGIIAGWDFAAWFSSPAFVWVCVLVGLYGLTVGAILAWDRIRKL